MAEPLPKFAKPPVVETALSVQFARLQGYSTAHTGWFWRNYLSTLGEQNQWTKINEVARLDDQFERLGQEEWARLGFRLGPGGESQRTQIIRSDEERMVQVQDSRFILNWRKQSGAYPSYPVLIKEFWTAFDAFKKFALDAGFGELQVNQWEVTYVNNVPRGDLWETPADWHTIMEALSFPRAADQDVQSETFSADWRFSIRDQGRLYLAMRHAKHQSGEEVLQTVFTARGPIDSEKGRTLAKGFEVGHEAIVRSFTAMTSSKAHKRWERTA